ncbi:MAG: hypothetical protein B7Z74_04575, partial [Deltaproteobacteria bacterium 21-66-5]
MIVYAVENIGDSWAETSVYLERHWAETCGTEAYRPDIDREAYERLQAAGALLFITARDDGKLVGYQGTLISYHLHSRHTLCALSDVYYLDPAYRNGRTGIRMLQRTEDELRRLGVKRYLIATETRNDKSAILERM